MKTNNYQFDLMHQGQDHKDVLYNETILKLDANLSFGVVGFIESPPENLFYHQRFIITHGQHQNKICYLAHHTKGVQYIPPYDNMLIYLINENCFAIFSDNHWQRISHLQKEQGRFLEPRFIGIMDRYNISGDNDFHYLYLQNNCLINLDKTNSPSLSVIIKQNNEDVFQVVWSKNILWPSNKPMEIVPMKNAIDFIKFYKIPESNHFLAQLINQNYQY